MSAAIERARAAAHDYLIARGYPQEARLVASGKGDDFAEVRLALKLLDQIEARMRHYADALEFYADGREDEGARARRALAGEPLPTDYID